ncbi:HesA/MoeB/ThiF family protein [Chryseolinea soli]|uniref:HesA/MoeB/ThiF family protein n=1 Tax=Chryseolinea soli TaxID=2321403 RepID=UPI00135A78FD|nr:ThiF family adenylyltransferase [Chryseolinea soli]
MEYQLRMAGIHFEEVKQHLFPGDGKEAIAIALCGRFNNGRVTMLLVHKLLLLPYHLCKRESDFIEWPTEPVVPFLIEAMQSGMAILKIHSHPGGYDQFSELDDISDVEFFTSVYGWTNSDLPHGSAVMLPDGRIFGRVILPDLSARSVDRILVAGHQIRMWSAASVQSTRQSLRTIQLFGEGTYGLLRQLKVGLVGCSGTGSIVVEQLLRYQVGTLVPIDGDHVEHKNLNRIVNARVIHAENAARKTDVVVETVRETGLGTIVIPFDKNLYESPEAIIELTTCDLVIGCMDTAEGRDLLNRLSTYYLVPYIDMGIMIDSDGKGGINKIEGSVHYVQPGMSSLFTRSVYTMEEVTAEALKRNNPQEYARLLEDGRKNGYKYVKDINVDRPAVISLNMQVASTAVNELLNRIHPYKFMPPESTAKIAIDITDNFMAPEGEHSFQCDQFLAKNVGRGDVTPLLHCVELGEKVRVT